MKIISHRGCWTAPEEKNTLAAFERAIDLGVGIETDLRDLGGELVISHDLPTKKAIRADTFFRLVVREGVAIPLAINVKSDGLQDSLKSMLRRFGVQNYFLFDMSVPDAWLYVQKGFPVFSRQSEFEPSPSLLPQSEGVWVDSFLKDDWITERVLERHLFRGKKVCVVSPELHHRPQIAFWKRLLAMPFVKRDDIMICTDYPEEARRFFCE
jgi:hypothetical protein